MIVPGRIAAPALDDRHDIILPAITMMGR